ncbi:C40 family peptidase [Tannerella forsythia]|uniref:NlpC/P60 family protein n=1 Tax=Tannerella forsythia TaxID=28112 RepID=A0A3P1Y0E7_TANFO|nr:C40 family peptidase [Tannerella forsythia]RRD62583.1 NlpC/P60 family protein [Tannerella forsythia]
MSFCRYIGKKRVVWLVVCMMSLMVWSCAAHKGTGALSVSEATETLSHRLGIPLTDEDNLELYRMVAQWIGTPHRMGRSTKKGTDCSGFVTNVYKKIYGKTLARSSAAMLAANCDRIDKKSLREGDLVFFYTRRKSKRPSHVGIYLKDGKFAHSSTSKGVIISRLEEPYYKKRWITGGVVR